MAQKRVAQQAPTTPQTRTMFSDVQAAGVVVFRPGREVLLVHRPRYDDWSFPKGKLDPGEHRTTAAVREVAEETGVRVRLGAPLASQRYPNGARMKSVHYWVGRVVGDDDVSGYPLNDEIDAVEWVPYDQALERLTYEHDVDTLREAKKLRKATHAVVVLRHGSAQTRKSWTGDDRRRPLVEAGRLQAGQLVPLLAAYGVTRVVSSPNQRCLQTVNPYVDATGLCLEECDAVSEEGSTPEGVTAAVEALVEGDDNGVLCTHRPVLPAVLDALGVAELEPQLETAEMIVAHVRKGRIVALERHGV